jgi:hypothetical protein
VLTFALILEHRCLLTLLLNASRNAGWKKSKVPIVRSNMRSWCKTPTVALQKAHDCRLFVSFVWCCNILLVALRPNTQPQTPDSTLKRVLANRGSLCWRYNVTDRGIGTVGTPEPRISEARPPRYSHSTVVLSESFHLPALARGHNYHYSGIYTTAIPSSWVKRTRITAD